MTDSEPEAPPGNELPKAATDKLLVKQDIQDLATHSAPYKSREGVGN